MSELIANKSKTRQMLDDRPTMYELIVSNISEGSIIELQKDEKAYETYDSVKDFIALLEAVWDTHMLATTG